MKKLAFSMLLVSFVSVGSVLACCDDCGSDCPNPRPPRPSATLADHDDDCGGGQCPNPRPPRPSRSDDDDCDGGQCPNPRPRP